MFRFCEFSRFADTHSCEGLKLHSQAHIYRNFPQVVEEEEFLDTPKDILIHFLESEKLKVDSEYQVSLRKRTKIQFQLILK